MSPQRLLRPLQKKKKRKPKMNELMNQDMGATVGPAANAALCVLQEMQQDEKDEENKKPETSRARGRTARKKLQVVVMSLLVIVILTEFFVSLLRLAFGNPGMDGSGEADAETEGRVKEEWGRRGRTNKISKMSIGGDFFFGLSSFFLGGDVQLDDGLAVLDDVDHRRS